MDRNLYLKTLQWRGIVSLSARRAWIEISALADEAERIRVALRKESVDRNDDYWAVGENWPEASPDQPSDHERLVALEAAMVDMLLGGGDDDV